MESVLLALKRLRDSINSLFTTNKAAVLLVANKIKTVRQELLDLIITQAGSITILNERANEVDAKVDALETGGEVIAVAVAGLTTTVTDVQTQVGGLTDTVTTATTQLQAVETLLLNASVKEFVYMTDGTATAADLLGVLAIKAGENGVDLVNQQYTVNVEGAKTFEYQKEDPAIPGTFTTETLALSGSGKLLVTIKDGAVMSASAIQYPTGGGVEVLVPIADVTTVAFDTEAAVAAVFA